MKKLLSHKTAIQITTNEPQSCVFCEGGVKPSFTKYTLARNDSYFYTAGFSSFGNFRQTRKNAAIWNRKVTIQDTV